MKKLILILTLAFIFGLTASISYAGDFRAVSIKQFHGIQPCDCVYGCLGSGSGAG
jgi:hypothetical protein